MIPASACVFRPGRIAYAVCGGLFTSTRKTFEAMRATSAPSQRSIKCSARFKNDVAPPAVQTRPSSTTIASGRTRTRG